MRRPVRAYEWAALAAITAGCRGAAPGHDRQGRSPTRSTTPPCAAWGCRGTTSSSAPSSRAASVSIDKPPVDLWLQVLSVKLFGFSSTDAEAARGASPGSPPCRCCSSPSGACGARRAGLAAAVGAGRAAGRGDHLAQRHDGRGDDGADRARAAADPARVRHGPLALAVRRSGGDGPGLRREDPRVARRAARAGLDRAARLPGAARAARAAARRGRRGVRRRRARLADRDAARARARPAVGDRLDQRQRVERRVRVQRHRTARRQIARTAVHRLRTRAQIPASPRNLERDHIPIVPPSPTRLLARIGPLSGERLGMELLAAAAARASPRCCGAAPAPGRARRARATTARTDDATSTAGARGADAHRAWRPAWACGC